MGSLLQLSRSRFIFSFDRRRFARKIAIGITTAAIFALQFAPLAQAATYYWDNVAGAGFGTAGGTWAAPTPGPIPGWNTDVTGAAAPASVTTATTDLINFGTATAGQGLAAGTITVGTVSAGNITFGSQSGAIILTGGTITQAAAETITVDNATDTINSILAGAATSLTKAGTGTLNLGGINTYAGATNVTAGTLNLTGARTVAAGSITVNGGGTLGISNGTFSLAASTNFIVGVASGAGTVNQTGGTLTLAATGGELLVGNGGTGTYNLSGGSLTTAAIATRGVMLAVNGSDNATFNLSGTGSLTVVASSALMIGRTDAAISSYTALFNQTAGTALVSGTLSLGGAAAAVSTGSTSTLTLTGGTFSATTFSVLAASTGNTSVINIGGTAVVTLPNLPTVRGTSSTATLNLDGGTLKNSATGTFITGLTNAFIKAGGATFDTGLNSTTVSQALKTDVVSTGGGLTKLGVNTLTLSGVNTYTGATTLTAGTLSVGVTGNLGAAASNLVFDGGTLQITGTTLTSFSGIGHTVSFNATKTVILDINNAANTFTADQVLNQTTGGLTKAGAGTLVLSLANSYSGATAISSGTLVAGDVAAFGTTSAISLTNGTTGGSLQLSTNTTVNAYAIGGSSGAGAGTIVSDRATAGAGITHVLGAAVLGSNTYNFTKGTNVTSGTAAISLASLNLAAGTAGTVILAPTTADLQILGAVNIGSGNNPKTLQLDGTSTGSSISGTISNGLNTLSVTKAGTGTWTLSGPNTYTGNTTVTGGTLNITGGGLTGNNTTSTLALGTTAANTVTNVSSNVSLFQVTGAAIANSNAVYNQTAGTVVAASTTSAFGVGNAGYGYFNLTGGSYTGNVLVSSGGAGSTGTGVAYVGGLGILNINTATNAGIAFGGTGSLTAGPGGTVTRTGAGAFYLTAFTGGTGTLNVAGGNVDLGTGLIRAGNGASQTGQTEFVNVAGGTLTMGTVVSNLGAAGNLYANFAGGTLKASAALNSPFSTGSGITTLSTIFGAITNNNNANTAFNTQIGTTSNFTGGLTVDTNNNNVTYGNALLGATGNGITQSNITVTGGSGYIGAPQVTFTGGTLAANGTPASGYAVISGGVVTGIVITSPGEYTVDPTVSLAGGGGTGASVALSALGANVADTGLTKINAGTLTLTATNTYAGATSVTGGTLTLSGAGSINSSSGITINGSGAKFLQTSSTASTPAITLTQGTLDGTTSVGAVTVGAGTGGIVANGNLASTTALTLASLNFTGAGAVSLRLAGDVTTATPGLTVTNALTTSGTVSVNITPTASFLNGSTYNLIGYGSFTGSNSNFALGGNTGLSGRQTGTFGNTGASNGFITLAVSGDTTVYTGVNGGNWVQYAVNTPTTATPNFALETAHTATDFWIGDIVKFNDTYDLGAGPVAVTATTVTIHGGNVSPAQVIFNNSAVNYTVTTDDGSGIAAGSMTKNGSGTVTINTTNSYTGGTNITAGTLVLGQLTDTLADTGAVTVDGATAILSIGGNSDTVGAVSLKNGASITGSGGTLTGSSYAVESGSISAILGGTGSVLNKTTAGTVTLTGVNAYTGATNVKAGSLVLAGGNDRLLTTGSVVIGDVATTGKLVLGDATAASNQTLASLTSTGLGGNVVGGNATTNSVLTLSSASTVTYNGILGGAGTNENNLALTKLGAGTLVLGGANTYTGATTLSAGILSLGNVAALGGNNPGVNGTSSLIMATGTTLRSTISSVVVSAPITATGSVTINAPNNNAGQVFSELILNGAIGGSANVTFSSILNANTIQTVTLGAASNYSGTTTIDNTAGTSGQMFVKLGATDALPTTTVLNILGGAGTGSGRGIGLNLFGFSQTLAGLTNTAFNLRAQEIVNSDASAAATLTINGSTDTTYSGNLGRSGAGFSVSATAIPGSTNGNNFGLTKNGSGTFTLTGANPFYGTTKILGGILSLGNASALSQSPLDTLNSIAGDATNGLRTTVTTLTLGGLTGNKNFANVFTTATGGPGNVTALGGYSGLTALTLNPRTGVTNSYSGDIGDGAGAMTLTETGAGIQVLTGTNTYTGVTTVNSAATLQLGDGTTGHDGTIASTSGITDNGTLIYNRFGALSTNRMISGTGAVTISGPGSQTLTAANSYSGITTIDSGATLRLGDGTSGNDGTITSSSGITNNGTLIYNRFGSLSSSVAIGGTGVVTKLGAGTQTLNAINTYTGVTSIQAGTLALGNTGSINNSSLIAISPTATFDVSAVSGYALAQTLSAKGAGTANIVGAIDAAAQKLDLQDGVNIGTLALSSDLNLNGATLTFDLSATTSDLIAVTGAATLAGTNTINVAPLTAATSLAVGTHAYTLLTAGSGLVSGNFALSSSSVMINSTTYNFSLSGDATHEYLDVTSIGVTAVNGVWNVNASGSWNTAGNWSGGVPGLSGSSAGNDTATFAAAATSVNPVVTLDGVNPVLKGITFNNATQSYTIAQGTGGTLTLNGGASPSTIDVTNGSHTISAPLSLATNTNITLANAGSLTLSGGQAWAGHNVAVSGAGTVTISGTQTNTSPATFTVNSGVTANINTNSGAGLSLVNSGTVNLKSSQNLGGVTINSGAHTNITTNTALPVATGPSVVVTPTLTIASHVVSGNTVWDGYLDLANNKLVVQTGGLSGTALQDAVKQVASQVKSGYNLANGSSTLWMGTGIGSSSAAADTRRIVGLAVFQNNTKSFGSLDGTVSDGTGNAFITNASQFGGVLPAKNDTLVKFTYFGDTDLDGVITAGDYANIDLAFAHQQTLGPQTGWANGDFDYDGSITAADYSLMDSAFAAQSGALSGEVHTLGSLGGSPVSVTAVPEPSTWLLGVMGIIGLLVMARRRKLRVAA